MKNSADKKVLMNIYTSSVRQTAWIVATVALLEAMMLVMTVVNEPFYRGYVWKYRILYIILMTVSLIMLFISFYIQRDFPDRYGILNIAYPVGAVIFYGWVLGITYFDAVANGSTDPTAFMTFSLMVPISFYMAPWLYAVIALTSNLLMLLILFMIPGSSSTLPNLCIYILFSVALGVSVLRLRRRLAQRIIEAEEQKEEIKELSGAQSKFFSNISHEIRTPINSIIGFNEMILRENVSEEINEDAENIRSAGNLLLHIINDVLDMSKLESGQMKLMEAPYNIGDILSEVVGMLWNPATEKGLEFRIELSPDLPRELFGDEDRIKQILINLLNNAIKYTAEGSVTLEVTGRPGDDTSAVIRFVISDTGIGIKKENIPYIFTAFRRVDEDKNRHIEGTGLGLSIVKQLTELMGGSVTVNSVYTKGTAFVVEIPQKILDETPVGKVDLQLRKKSTDYKYFQSFEAPDAKALVVDDTSTNLLVVTKLLARTGIHIDTASSGEEALKKTLAEKYHVILMDHKMPGMDGVECMHIIRTQTGGLCHASKIIALTANAGQRMEELYLREGFDGYLNKPVTGKELEDMLLKCIPSELITHKRLPEDIIEESTAWIREGRARRPVGITTESVADIPLELLERYNIKVIPHLVQTDGGRFKDDTEIDTRGLLDYIAEGRPFVETSEPAVTDYEQFFATGLSTANHIIHIAVSDKIHHSGCDEARTAAGGFENVTVVDSGHLSSGQGLMAIQAAMMAEEGADPARIIEMTTELGSHIHTDFIVDSLDFLSRKKQVAEQAAHFARALMAHPVLRLKKGRIRVSKLYFGSRERAWKKYIADELKNPMNIDRSILFITYVGIPSDDINRIRDMVESKVHFEKVYLQKASPAVAANCGPGTFGLIFLSRK